MGLKESIVLVIYVIDFAREWAYNAKTMEVCYAATED
jgi:hypothetical protein